MGAWPQSGREIDAVCKGCFILTGLGLSLLLHGMIEAQVSSGVNGAADM